MFFSFEEVLKESAKLGELKEQEYEAYKKRRASDLKDIIKSSEVLLDRRKMKKIKKHEVKLEEKHDELVSLYQQGYSQAKIAEKMDYAISTVAEYMRSNGMGKAKR